jgi:hypothetical protein
MKAVLMVHKTSVQDPVCAESVYVMAGSSAYFPADVSLDASVGGNAENTRYMSMSHHLNAGQNHNRKIFNTSSENVAKFKYLEMELTYQNCINK